MPNIIITYPTIYDIQELNHLFTLTISDTFNKHSYGEYVDELMKEIESKKSLLLNHLNSVNDGIFLIAKCNGKIVGTIYYGKADPLISELSKNELTGIGEIGCVYIHPEYQKQGIGKKLLQSMYSKMFEKGIPEFVLEAFYKNAQKAWTKLLGEPKVFAKDYWGKDEHHMIWHKRLK